MFKRPKAFFSTIALIGTIILLTPAAWRFFNQKQIVLPVRLLVTRGSQTSELSLPAHWVVDNLKTGDTELSPSGRKLAQLKDTKQYQEGTNKIGLLDVDLVVTRNPLTGRFTFKQQDLLIGSTVTLRLGSTLISAQVISFLNQSKETEVELIVDGYLYTQRDWFAYTISIGDMMTHPSTQAVLGKIVDKEIYPADTEYLLTSGGSILRRNSSRYRDVKLTLSLKAERRGDTYYFASLQPVKIGNTLYLPFDKYNLYGLNVVSFKEDQPLQPNR